MPELLEVLNNFDTVLHRATPAIATRLQLGLTRAEIEKQLASFSWKLPSDAYELYQWHNGLSGKPGTLNLVEKLIRLKGKWHGELSGRENEIHLKLSHSQSETFRERLMVAKLLPFEYALAGHRHLKLGRCSIDLLPFVILNDDRHSFYCMMRLDPKKPTVYCVNGTNLPPVNVTEAFLSTQLQFNGLQQAIALLAQWFQSGSQSEAAQENLTDEADAELDARQLEQLYQSQN